ncbi:hypothetical protein [Pedobacter sp. CFBP9032]|uniref:hypothetical protein n=1 Tax=Pedobacter sp. CFBP9032 TaxID=3096539 RepID=UPI002A6A8FB6|nr:hypothetical protein [Pedobacter sp. CFBP9032]MDY0903334.1 hypothetical protein [Pedobacter sp. CFBP9032]
MKKSILTLFVLLPFAVFAQKQESTPFPGATKIIIQNNNSAADNYTLTAEKLLDQSYMIDKSDKEFYQLYTGGIKVYGEGSVRLMSLYVLNRKGSITIVGRTKKTEQLRIVNTPQDTDNYENAVYKKSLLMKNVYEKMEQFAKSIGGTIVYSE